MSSDLTQLFHALADGTRLRLINLLSGGELCVCYLVEVLGEAQPKISRHLSYLRRAGVVAARRDGKWIHYRLVMPDGARGRLLECALAALAADRAMQDDRLALLRTCCGATLPATLQHAPKPELHVGNNG